MPPKSKDWIFKINKISKEFKNSAPPLVFKNIKVIRNSLTIITGETGIGKTTLLNMIGFMDNVSFNKTEDIYFRPHKNSLSISYKELMAKNPLEMDKLRYSFFGFMFQQDHLIDAMTGWENVVLPYLLRHPEADFNEAKEKATNIIKECNFNDMQTGLMERSPSTFSGGQRQRVALIRALIHDPLAIFADEPLASVDKKTALEIMRVLYKEKQKGKTIIMVVHDTHEHIFEDMKPDKIHLLKM